MSRFADSEPSRRPSVPFPWTIEAQLQAYSNGNDRYELLWHAWKQNKRWLVKLLDLAFSSFPGYSSHDASHADTVLHNIERILGEERIRGLSASDCFMLLHTAYIHDIGMCITAEDRESAIRDSRFNKMLDTFEQSSDPMVQKFAQALRRTDYEQLPDRENARYQDACRRLNEEKLLVYHALVYALAEYHRVDHGGKAKLRLEELVDRPDKLGGGFSMSGVPMRIFLSIAACAGLHTTWGFAPILELPREDSGYVLDQIHPRFVAVMLQLGDALDLDNDRFHPLMLDYAGNVSHTSKLHYEKHKAIRCLQITPSEIFIEASCPDQEVLHLVRQACDCVEDLLKEASYYWAEIVPPEVHGCLPTMLPPKLLINGKSIPKELVSCRFNISQEKAFRLLEGANLYANRFAFLRELVQNALDAAKLQCWRDYQNSTIWGDDGVEPENELALLNRMEPWRYPIEIAFTVGAVLEDGEKLFTPEQVKWADEQRESYTYGVWVEVRDSGTGITQDDLASISKVGTSHERREGTIQKMPCSLRPTGKFGIGLQSAFVMNDRFSCKTHARNDKAYYITFTSVTDGHDGYINAEPVDEQTVIPYGSVFEVFVPHDKKNDNRDDLSIWSGEDPFDPNNQRDPELMCAEDLQAQMISYIDSILGEKLFPVCVTAYNGFSDTERHGLKESRQEDRTDEASADHDSQPRHLLYTRYHSRQEWKPWTPEQMRGSLSWGLWEEQDLRHDLKGGDVYWFDLEKCKLHIWSAERKVFARFGASRFLNAPILQDTPRGGAANLASKGISIFYKGMRLSVSTTMDGDMELLERIDIKDAPTENILQLSRDELTKEGEEYLKKEIFPALMDTASRAVYDFSKNNQEKHKGGGFIAKVAKRFFSPQGEEEHDRSAEERSSRMVSLILLAYFAKVSVQDRTCLPTCLAGQDMPVGLPPRGNCMWERLLEKCANALDRERKAHSSRWNWGLLRVRTFEDADDIGRDRDQDLRTIADVLSNRDSYAVLSMRETTRHEWKHSLCRVDVVHAVKLNPGTDYKNIPEVLEHRTGKIIYEKFTDYFARWMLHNIPTLESYTHLSHERMPGNIRINLLTRSPVNEVYLNDDMKYLLLKKALKRHRVFKASRFSTLAWKGYGCLVVDEIPNQVCQVDCGFAAGACHPNMILPVLGSDLENILRFGGLDEQTTKKLWSQVNRIEEIIAQWDQHGLAVNTLKNIEADRYEKKNRNYLKEMDLDTFLSITFQDLDSDTKKNIYGWRNKPFFMEIGSTEEESFYSALGEHGKECWTDFVRATVLSRHAQDIYVRTAFSEKKKRAFVQELWSGESPEQKALLGEVQRRGRYALPQDLAVKLYQNMIYEMLGCVQTVALHSFENRRRNS